MFFLLEINKNAFFSAEAAKCLFLTQHYTIIRSGVSSKIKTFFLPFLPKKHPAFWCFLPRQRLKKVTQNGEAGKAFFCILLFYTKKFKNNTKIS